MNDFDYIDAYKLTVDNTPLFSEQKTFISQMGLPQKASIAGSEYQINSESDINRLLSENTGYDITLDFNGIEMEVWNNDYRIIPFSIDFRKTPKSIVYGEILFDKQYSVEQFRKLFPNSASIEANPTIQIPSLFEMKTGEKGKQYRHFSLNRKTKDDPDATPMVEFTFENDKLIYIFFANF